MHQIMENGDSLNLEATLGWNFAMPIVQGAMILPCPEQINCYYVFHTNLTTQNEPNGLHLISKILHCTTVDMTYNNGLGKVIEKNKIIVNDTLDLGKITATRHANGRDWWVIIPEYQTNKYYTLLITPQGLKTLAYNP
ncbi:MAG: hypothetical protein U5O16_01775 [Rhodococcus sp. (in: high G+C Gram-positive bacteria)]|uniref:hypothetical protein n=1 Tax=Rhodococcus sp. TaxID=1831 RepID=UPI002AD8F7FD|nr:hypothetical protein [Rhodococcus sp. (in: high G+C Gram-positive bacteria)]